MSEMLKQQDDQQKDPLNKDSTQQLYNDWLQMCLLPSSCSDENNTLTATKTTYINNVKEEAKVAFCLFTISNCNMD
jgi:hypothetical protein